MAQNPSLTEVLVSAQTTIYMDKLQKIVCGNCGRVKSTHAGDKCLFDTTSFQPISARQLRMWAIQHFSRNDDMLRYVKKVIANEDEHGDRAVIRPNRVPKDQ